MFTRVQAARRSGKAKDFDANGRKSKLPSKNFRKEAWAELEKQLRSLAREHKAWN
jgi:hypothetical protein